MKRIIYSGLILFFFFASSAYSQIMNTDFQEFYDDFEQLRKFNEKKEVLYDGSPYLDDEFVTGKIFLASGQEYQRILLRYNIFYDQFEFSKDGKAFAIENDPDFSTIKIADRVFKHNTYEYKGETEKGYLELLVEGEYSLYIKHITILRDGEESGAYQQATKPTFYPQKPVFLIGAPNKNIIEIRSSKDLLNEFKDLEKSIDKYTGNKKLKLKKQDDYIDLVNYLNSGNRINTN